MTEGVDVLLAVKLAHGDSPRLGQTRTIYGRPIANPSVSTNCPSILVARPRCYAARRRWRQEAYLACWVETRCDPVTGRPRQVTVCRLAGGDLREYPGSTPPSDLDPAVGTDAVGVCWFWTSRDTDWELLSTFSDGSAVLGLYINGFLALDTGQIRRCTSEPIIQDPPPLFAWDMITQYVHNPPQPELNPPIGRGLTGLETFAGITIPDPWSDSSTIPGYTIDVEVIRRRCDR